MIKSLRLISAALLIAFVAVAPALSIARAAPPDVDPQHDPHGAEVEAGDKAHESVHGHEAAAHAAPGARAQADEDKHWWIGQAVIPVGLREKVAGMIGPSLMGDPPAKLNVAHLFMGLLVFLIGVGMALAVKTKVREEKLPPRKWGAFAFFDVMMEAILGLMTNMMPRERALKYLPVVMAAAVFILISNLLGLVPGFVPPTQSLNTTLALGLVAFVYYNYQGLKAQGPVKYFKHFLGPLLPLAPLILPIELISHTVRPLSLGLRLMGNMFGDHQVLFIFMSFGLPLIPLPLMALGLMVCVVQTVVFTLLFIVYLSLATETHESHDDHLEHEHDAHAPAHAH